MNLRHTLLAGVAMLATLGSLPVSAATNDGTISNAANGTSSTTFINTFNGTAARRVRVFGVQDTTLDALLDANGVSISTSASDTFCVANNAGGAVRLSFAFGNGTVPTAKSTATTTLSYNLKLSSATGAQTTIASNATTFTVPAADVQTSLTTCTTGNVTKAIDAVIPTANSETFTELVTITATPI